MSIASCSAYQLVGNGSWRSLSFCYSQQQIGCCALWEDGTAPSWASQEPLRRPWSSWMQILLPFHIYLAPIGTWVTGALRDALLYTQDGGWSSVGARTTPASCRSNYVAPASTVFPVAIELALLLMLLHDYALIFTLKLLNISKFSAYIMNVTWAHIMCESTRLACWIHPLLYNTPGLHTLPNLHMKNSSW